MAPPPTDGYSRAVRASNYNLPQAPQASACKDTSKKRSADASRLGILLLATGPKRSIGHLLGGEKNLVAILTVPPWPQVAASMESCRFAARRSLGGRFWSVVDVRKRLHRVRGRFDQSIHTSTGAWQCAALEHKSPMFWIQSSPESSKHGRMRRRRLPDPRPVPEGVREPICMRKK